MQPWRRTDWTLPDWTAYAWALEHNLRHNRHIKRFPHELVVVELDIAALLSLRALLHQSRRFGCPITAGHWITATIMDVTNQPARLARIERRNAA